MLKKYFLLSAAGCFILSPLSSTYAAARDHREHPNFDEVMAFRGMRLSEREVRLAEDQLRFDKQTTSAYLHELSENRRLQQQQFQAQQAREKQEREEKSRQQAQAQRQHEAQAKRQADLEQAADFVYRWAQEKESRWDPFMKSMITKYNNRQGFLPEEISQLLHRKTIILQALKIAENDLRTRNFTDPKVEGATRKCVEKGITGITYKNALLDVQGEKDIQQIEKDRLLLQKQILLEKNGWDLEQFPPERLATMSLDYIRKEYGN